MYFHISIKFNQINTRSDLIYDESDFSLLDFYCYTFSGIVLLNRKDFFNVLIPGMSSPF